MASDSDRRSFLRQAGILGVGMAAGGAFGYRLAQPPRKPAPAFRLPKVKVAPDRVINTLVGLRPYRTTGFRLERETIETKTIVHNYGHGGSGITLSWGCAHLAVEELASTTPEGTGTLPDKVAVLGAGALGLATARLLQKRGVAVTIYAAALPPDTTSNIAGGQWAAALVADSWNDKFRTQFVRAMRLSHRYFQALAGPRYGVRWLPDYNLNAYGISGPLKDLFPEVRTIPSGEHPFPVGEIAAYTTMMVETPVYLREMLRDVRIAGGRIVIRTFETPTDVAALPESAIVNCTGLGAGKLFADTAVVPVRGQLVILLPQPEIRYLTSYNGLYMMPRRDGIVLGGTFERGETDLTPDAETTKRIVDGHKAMFDAMKV